jgi:hypothetical protein
MFYYLEMYSGSVLTFEKKKWCAHGGRTIVPSLARASYNLWIWGSKD